MLSIQAAAEALEQKNKNIKQMINTFRDVKNINHLKVEYDNSIWIY